MLGDRRVVRAKKGYRHVPTELIAGSDLSDFRLQIEVRDMLDTLLSGNERRIADLTMAGWKMPQISKSLGLTDNQAVVIWRGAKQKCRDYDRR